MDMNNLQVLLTGAGGYLGKRLAQDLPLRGVSVKLTDLVSGDESRRFDTFIHPLDLLDEKGTSSGEAFSGIDVVVHAATRRPDSDREKSGTGTQDRFRLELDNLRMAQSLMEGF